MIAARSQSEIGNPKSEMFLAERVGFEPTERFPVHSISSAANSTTLAPLRENIANFRLPIADWVPRRAQTNFAKRPIGNRQSEIGNAMAERVGFEPTVGVNPLRFSRPVH
jgi:hypothetical protein